MTDDTLKNILSLADDDYIAAADPLSAPAPQKKRKVDVKRVLLVAAVLAVLVSATVIVADALEYNKIIIYLSERNISVDGMTRSEIKEAYWNIKKGTWNIKTTDFTGNGSDAAFVISGNEIMLPRPDPLPAKDENPVAVVDSYVNEDGCLVIVTADGETHVTEMPSNPTRAEIVYDGMTFSIEKSDLVGTHYVLESGVIDNTLTKAVLKLVDGSVVWGYTLPSDFATIYNDLAETDGFLAVSGSVSPTTGSPDFYDFILFLSKDGTPMGKATMKETIKAMFPSNGGLIVFADAYRTNTMVTYEYDRAAVQRSRREQSVGGASKNFRTFDDGYFFMVGGSQEKLVFADAHGIVRNSFVYAYPELTNNYISISPLTDRSTVAYNGKLYISATLSNFHGIDHGNVLESCRETIASVLFVCDPEKGLEDYTLIRGCVGGDMEVRDGTLCWRVGSIAGAISVAMGHCSVEGMAQVYEIAFQGDTIRVCDTGVLANWDNGFWML